ncbi:MAG TPA: right-handed parallel beta-helix repeat-containing protein [Phycisphaerae bacterium]|nr:right-handed parallel beta-helix repeat-containing protein [Phycisphaerae bacterium]
MSKPSENTALSILATPVLVLGLAAGNADADTIYVCWDGSGHYLTIQEGIDAAQDGDEVVVCDGVYTGPGNRDLDFGGKDITVGSANGPDNCIIDCQWLGRGFDFHNGETAASVVNGFTIRNGYPLFAGGAGICCSSSSPTISNCRIMYNTAPGDGGGVACFYSSPTITACAITANTGDVGGGISCWESSPTITNSLIAGNTAYG